MSRDHSGKTELEGSTTLGMEQLPELVDANDILVAHPEAEVDAESATAERMIPHFASADQRYQRVQLLGEGSSSQVFRVVDKKLGGTSAMKVLRPELKHNDQICRRFLNEAKLIFHLSHPCIISVYDIGQLQSGQLYFTMQEVLGNTLQLSSLSASSLRSLIEQLSKVADAVGYAHEMGVVHRDLKPENILVGAHGELMIMDWGIAKATNSAEHFSYMEPLDVRATVLGTVIGTPLYMSPEQARGESVDSRSDIFAIGLMLYEAVLGGLPSSDAGVSELLQFRGSHPLEPLVPSDDVDLRLCSIINKALAWEQADRYQSAKNLHQDLEDWIGGFDRRDKALRLIEEADRIKKQMLAVDTDLVRLRNNLLGAHNSGEASERIIWELDDRIREKLLHQGMLHQEYKQLLRSALTHDAHLSGARERLAKHYHYELLSADSSDERVGVETAKMQIAWHSGFLLDDSIVRASSDRLLRGEGVLSIDCEVPVHVTVSLLQINDRRWQRTEERSLGTTPIESAVLPMGRYLVSLKSERGDSYRFPIKLSRQENYRPLDQHRQPMKLRVPFACGINRCFIAAGWFEIGGDEMAWNGQPHQQCWLPDFLIDRYPVTNREYLEFINDLHSSGQSVIALLPRERNGQPLNNRFGSPYKLNDDGQYILGEDFDGDNWSLDWPVIMVNIHCATAYAEWRSKREGNVSRLPTEREWEKAARGVDGRIYPWGNSFDPRFCCVQLTPRKEGNVLPANVTDFSCDESPYGVRQLSGGVMEWTMSKWPGSLRRHVESCVVRGGSWYSPPEQARLCSRGNMPENARFPSLGFRLVTEIDE